MDGWMDGWMDASTSRGPWTETLGRLHTYCLYRKYSVCVMSERNIPSLEHNTKECTHTAHLQALLGKRTVFVHFGNFTEPLTEARYVKYCDKCLVTFWLLMINKLFIQGFA